VAGEQPYVSQRAAGFVSQPRSARDECAAAGVGRAASQTKVGVGGCEPVDDADATEWQLDCECVRSNNVKASRSLTSAEVNRTERSL